MLEPHTELLSTKNSVLPLSTKMREIHEELEGADEIVFSTSFADSDRLEFEQIADGFKQTQIPMHNSNGAAFVVTVADPNSEFPEHKHSDVSVFRFVVSGEIKCGANWLKQGDWMFVPKGVAYSLLSGPTGAMLLHGYGPD